MGRCGRLVHRQGEPRPDAAALHGQITQKVRVVGPDGRPATAYYPMTQLPDGSWRIDGCYLQAPEEHQA